MNDLADAGKGEGNGEGKGKAHLEKCPVTALVLATIALWCIRKVRQTARMSLRLKCCMNGIKI